MSKTTAEQPSPVHITFRDTDRLRPRAEAYGRRKRLSLSEVTKRALIVFLDDPDHLMAEYERRAVEEAGGR